MAPKAQWRAVGTVTSNGYVLSLAQLAFSWLGVDLHSDLWKDDQIILLKIYENASQIRLDCKCYWRKYIKTTKKYFANIKKVRTI